MLRIAISISSIGRSHHSIKRTNDPTLSKFLMFKTTNNEDLRPKGEFLFRGGGLISTTRSITKSTSSPKICVSVPLDEKMLANLRYVLAALDCQRILNISFIVNLVSFTEGLRVRDGRAPPSTSFRAVRLSIRLE